VNQPFKRKGGKGGGLKVEGRIHNICFVGGVLRWDVPSAIELSAMNDEDCATHASG